MQFTGKRRNPRRWRPAGSEPTGRPGAETGSQATNLEVSEPDLVRDRDLLVDGETCDENPEAVETEGPEQIQPGRDEERPAEGREPELIQALTRTVDGLLTQYTLAELQLIVMAAAYEIHDRPVASDSTYDLLAGATSTPNIPSFDPSTGQWVHEIMTPEIEALVLYCIDRVEKVKHDGTCHHTYIAEYCEREG